MSNPTWLYVGAVYAAAVALARRAGVELPKRVALFFYILVLLFLWLPMTRAYVNVQSDVLYTLPPWSYLTDDHTVRNGEMNDVALQMVPWAADVRDAWRSGRLPLWNERSGSGTPLVANGQSAAFSPLRLVALPLSLAHSMTAEAAMKMLVALTFAYLWCRRRSSVLASVIGACTFGFCGFIAVWLHFPHVTTGCFLPAVMLAVDLLAEEVRWRRFLFAIAVWVAMLCGGHPETAAHAFIVALLYVLWIMVVQRRPLRLVVPLGGALFLAAVIASPVLAPLVEAIPKSQRMDILKVKPYARETTSFSDFGSFVVQLQPHIYGRAPTEARWGPAVSEPISGFAGVFAAAAWFAMLAHGIARRDWRSREAFCLAASIFLLGVLYAWPGFGDVMHRLLPHAAHSRFRLPLALLLAALAAAAVDLVQVDRRSLLIGLAVMTAVILALLLFMPFPSAQHQRAAVLAAWPGALAIGSALVMTLYARARFAATLVLLAAVVADLFVVGRHWNPPLPQSSFYPRRPLIAALDELLRRLPPNAPARIVGNDATLYPEAHAVYGFEDIRVHDPMANARYLRFLQITGGYDRLDYFGMWREFDKHVIDFLNVRYVAVDPSVVLRDTDRYALLYDGPDGRIYENRTVLPRFYPVRNVLLEFRDDLFEGELARRDDWSDTAMIDKLEVENEAMRRDFFAPRPADAPRATSSIVRAAPTEYAVDVRAPRYTLVVSSIPWWPGWKVTRNGERTRPIRVNGAFLGFAVPPGTTHVRVWYAPWTFWGSAIVSLLTVAALAIATLTASTNRRHRRASATLDPT
ncbi:MAG TPA: YfhO family protein [Thermoanaerobaculia bacterium]